MIFKKYRVSKDIELDNEDLRDIDPRDPKLDGNSIRAITAEIKINFPYFCEIIAGRNLTSVEIEMCRRFQLEQI